MGDEVPLSLQSISADCSPAVLFKKEMSVQQKQGSPLAVVSGYLLMLSIQKCLRLESFLCSIRVLINHAKMGKEHGILCPFVW